ncbi:MAG: hypothetical protein J2P37_36250 [Ktedonobacteraceae bacterium]|nr:hypothetical protein [Ktedonobacteraceae bacterium]
MDAEKLRRYQRLARRYKSSIETGQPAISEAEDEERIRLHYELNIDGAGGEQAAWDALPEIEISSSDGHRRTIPKPKRKG